MERTKALLDGVVEVRILDVPRVKTVAGYFDDFDALEREVKKYDDRGNVYFTINPVKPALLARAANRLIEHPKHTTSDTDIERRRWLLVDIDPVRPSGVSATDEEVQAALLKTRAVYNYLTKQDWPAPVVCSSGNGNHLLYSINLPNSDEARELIKNCLVALSMMFDDEQVSIDTSVFNAARIARLYGTMTVKGDNTPERPHRRSGILTMPEELKPVPVELLKKLTAQAPKPQTKPQRNYNGEFNLEEWVSKSGLQVAYCKAWQGGTRWVLSVCPWDPSHTDRSAYIVQFPGGAIAAGCHHNGCQGKGWHELRDTVEPGWREQRREHYTRPIPEPKQKQTKPELNIMAMLNKPDTEKETKIEWAIPGIAPLGYVTLLIGDPKAGKTWLSLRLAAELSSGGSLINGFARVDPCKVLYLMGDTGAGLVNYRLKRTGWPFNKDRLSFVYAEEVRKQGADLDLGTNEGWHVLNLLVAASEPKIIFIDTLTSFHAVDESDNASMKPVISKLRDLAAMNNIAVVVLHHTRKKKRAEYGMNMTQHDSVGAGVLSRLVGNIVGVDRKVAEDEEISFLVQSLASWFKEFPDFAFTLDDETDAAGRDWVRMNVDLAPKVDKNARESIEEIIKMHFWAGDPFTRKDIIMRTGLGHNTVSQILTNMVHKGKLTSSGSTKDKTFNVAISYSPD